MFGLGYVVGIGIVCFIFGAIAGALLMAAFCGGSQADDAMGCD